MLFSDGKETVPSNPDNPKGAFTAARTAKDQGVPISTISFGTPYGYVEINDQRQPVPVDDETLKKVAELSGGNSFNASNLQELNKVFEDLQQQIGYETIKGDASVGWLRLGSLLLALAALAALLINRRLPGLSTSSAPRRTCGRGRSSRNPPRRRTRRAGEPDFGPTQRRDDRLADMTDTAVTDATGSAGRSPLPAAGRRSSRDPSW